MVNDERSRLLAVGGEFTTTALRARRWRVVLGVGVEFSKSGSRRAGTQRGAWLYYILMYSTCQADFVSQLPGIYRIGAEEEIAVLVRI